MCIRDRNSAPLTVAKGNEGAFTFKQDGNGGAGGVLYFHRDATKLHFEMCIRDRPNTAEFRYGTV